MTDTKKFIGKTKKSAQDLCEQLNLIFRLVSVDGQKFLGYPEDTRDDRICVEIEAGIITKVVIQ